MKTLMDERLYRRRKLRDAWYGKPSFLFDTFIGLCEILMLFATGAMIVLAFYLAGTS